METNRKRRAVETEISRYYRELSPADHYRLKTQPFSVLSQTDKEKYDSGVFETGGHKWKSSLYPKGNKKHDGNGYISLYLVIEETNAYAHGWKVLVNFKMFVFDQIHHKHLTIQDADGAVRHFDKINKEWGIRQLISLKSFNDSSNGNDSCVFGQRFLS
nr:ubiquitin C-terminal hydrolase 12-like [Ziziphus jujuba var. spinosa]